MFRFGNPQAFAFLWLLPILGFIFIFAQRRALGRIQKAIGAKLTPFLMASYSPMRRRVKLGVRFLALVFFILALARPQTNKGMTAVKSEGVELIIALDVSTSMLAEDIKPSRLEYAKSELNKLLDMLGGDKVGMVAFAGSAVLLSPLTTDKSALKMYVEQASTQSVQTQGTDFRKALMEAHLAFEHGGLDTDEHTRVTRVVLIASDGEDWEPGALDEAKKMVGDGIRIFTLAFGTERGAPIPVRDDRGFLKGYKRDRQNSEVLTTVKGDFLRELASVGKGSFYYASFGGREAKRVREDLDKLEKTAFDSEVSASYDEKYQLPLVIGILLTLLDLLISERRKEGRIWRGRFEVSGA